MDVFKKGMLVKSLRGHDNGIVYAISSIEKDFLYLVNGEERTIDRPKKKRIKHVQRMNKIINLEQCNDVQLKREIKVALK